MRDSTKQDPRKKYSVKVRNSTLSQFDSCISNKFHLQPIDYSKEIELPSDKKRLLKPSNLNYSVTQDLSKNLSLQLKSLASKYKIELSLIFLTAFQFLIYRCTRQKCFIIGVDNPNKFNNSTHRIIPLKAHINDDSSFISALKLNQQNLSLVQKQFLLSPHSVENNLEIHPSRQDYDSQVQFSYNMMQQEVQKNNSPDLRSFVCEKGKTFQLSCEGSSDLFELETIKRLTSHFICLLNSIVDNPHKELYLLNFLNREEKEKLLDDLNLEIEGQCFDCFSKLFEEQVQQHPHATAAMCHEEHLTYKQLDEISNQFAHFLKEKGFKLGSVIGVCLRPNLHFIAIVIGILKAGGVYLPLDPSYPDERLHSMCEDASPQLILIEKNLTCNFPQFQHVTLNVEDNWDTINCFNKEIAPEVTINSDDLAYIVYTSGSTGHPKGIMIQHSSLYQIATSRKTFYPTDIRSILVGAIGFDSSMLIIFHTLIAGGVICIPDLRTSADSNRIVEFIRKYSVNYLICVPSFYSKILDQSRNLLSLEHVSLAGEEFSNNLVDLHAKFACNAVLYNEYGPSECAIGSTLAKIYDPKKGKAEKITIGYPLPNTQVYILDNKMQIVPVGVKGEIFIRGIGLAKGYLNKQAVTDENFISVSIANQPPIRLYRSGDFGRLLTNGQIEFFGRDDHQVKFNGYRVELGEVELAINQYKDVKKSVVMVQTNAEGEKRLIAYFSAKIATLAEDSLCSYLYNLLPTYMVPSQFIQVDQFPLTPNGKIDREALSKISSTASNTINKLAKQHSKLEKELQIIWIDVLKNQHVGIYDNFFDLGGDSLLATTTQIVIEERLSIKLAITDLFRFPTIFSLAQHLNNQSKKNPCIKTSAMEKQSTEAKKATARKRFKKIRKRAA